MKRERNAKKAEESKGASSQLKTNQQALNILCKVSEGECEHLCGIREAYW